MSLTLATVADALIEFILSLLQDPEVRAEFEEDPDAALAQRGLSHVSPADVQAVAPVIIERTQVVQVPVYVRQQAAQPEPRDQRDRDQPDQHHSNPVVREIQQVSNNFSWVDDRDTIVDQSVNQNIWAKGDVTQTFDNEAVVASGDEAIAGAGDVDVDKTYDNSTTIEAGENVNIGNETDVTVIEDSFTEETETSTNTDGSTVIDLEGSGNDASTDVVIDGSMLEDVVIDGGDSADAQSEAPVEEAPVEEEALVEEAPVEEASIETASIEEAPVEEAPVEGADAGYTESAVEYAELESDVDVNDSAFEQTDVVIEESTADDNF